MSRGGGRSKRLAVEDVLVLTAARRASLVLGQGSASTRTAPRPRSSRSPQAGRSRGTERPDSGSIAGTLWPFPHSCSAPGRLYRRCLCPVPGLRGSARKPRRSRRMRSVRSVKGARRGYGRSKPTLGRTFPRPPRRPAPAPRSIWDRTRAAPPRGFTLRSRPSATLERAFWYSALLLAFLLCAAAPRAVAAPRSTERRCSCFFGVLAAVGIANRLDRSGARMLWVRDAPPTRAAAGPYVNASHFAG